MKHNIFRSIMVLVFAIMLTSCNDDSSSYILSPWSRINNSLSSGIDSNSIVGIVEFHYNHDDYYTSGDSNKRYHNALYYQVTAIFANVSRKGYYEENSIKVNSLSLTNNGENYYQTGYKYYGYDTDLSVHLGNESSNIIEKDASELYPAFSHNISFGKPAKLLNFTPNQIVNKSQDLHISWEASSNELTEFTVHIFSLVPKDNGNNKPIYSKIFKLQNVNSLTIPKEVLTKCIGTINELVLVKKEGVLVPIDVNRAMLNDRETYNIAYIAHSNFRTSFLVR